MSPESAVEKGTAIRGTVVEAFDTCGPFGLYIAVTNALTTERFVSSICDRPSFEIAEEISADSVSPSRCAAKTDPRWSMVATSQA